MVDVLKRADKKGIRMEIPEAMDVAQREILFLEGENEKKRVKLEMDLDRKKKENDEMLKQVHAKHSNPLKFSKDHATFVIQNAIKIWLARKILRRKCADTFEKLFDVNYCAFYYKNKTTVR